MAGRGGQCIILHKGDRYKMPNGVIFVIGDKILDEWGTAIELINEKSGCKYTNDIEKVRKFLRREKAIEISRADQKGDAHYWEG